MDIIQTCPYNATCEEIKDNKLHRCRMYIELQGTDASGNEHNRWECAIAIMPVLQIEASNTNRQISASIESARNVSDRNSQQANYLLQQYTKELN